MSDHLDKWKEDIDKFFSSEKGKESIKKYAEEAKKKREMREFQTERFWKKFHGGVDPSRFHELVEKIIEKYGSDKYRDFHWKKHSEPPEDLNYVLYDVAVKYGREFTEDEYNSIENTMFTDSIYVLDEWCFESYSGQGGSYVKISKYYDRMREEDRYKDHY